MEVKIPFRHSGQRILPFFVIPEITMKSELSGTQHLITIKALTPFDALCLLGAGRQGTHSQAAPQRAAVKTFEI